MPDKAAGDPHPSSSTGTGDIWFTVQQGNFVGKLTVATGAVRLIRSPTENALPYGIGIDGTTPLVRRVPAQQLGTVIR